jgi:hypothetical protein
MGFMESCFNNILIGAILQLQNKNFDTNFNIFSFALAIFFIFYYFIFFLIAYVFYCKQEELVFPEEFS